MSTWWMPDEQADIDPWFFGEDRRWDTMQIGEASVPGIVDVKGKGGLKIDEKVPKGRSAVRLEFSGYAPYKFTVTIVLYRKVDWESYVSDILPLVRPPNPGDSAQKLPHKTVIVHPALHTYSIKQCVISHASLPESAGQDAKGRQIKTVTLDCIEWFPIEWRNDPQVAGAGGGTLLGANVKTPGLNAPVVTNFVLLNNGIPSDHAVLNAPGVTPKGLIGDTKKKQDALKLSHGPDPLVDQKESPGTPTAVPANGR